MAVGTMQENGATCILISGGFTIFTQDIAQKLGFAGHHGNILGIKDGKLTGTVEEPILDKESKLAFLKAYTQQLNIDLAETMAIGDGANDLPMLAAAGVGIGYHPKPLLEENILNWNSQCNIEKLSTSRSCFKTCFYIVHVSSQIPCFTAALFIFYSKRSKCVHK